MIKLVADFDALNEVARGLIKDKFKPGFDGMSAEGVILWLKVNRNKIIKLLSSGEYEPMPVLLFTVAKQNGKYRSLSKVTAIDTVIQKRILDVFTPICEKGFSDSSYAYRPGRGVSSALEEFCCASSQFRYAARVDISGCYDNIDHGILEKLVLERTKDSALTKLIMAFVKAPAFEDGSIYETAVGLHQGAVLSPLLCNIYLHQLDAFLEGLGVRFVRYADDLAVFGDTVSELKDRVSSIKIFLADSLRLALNEKKTDIDFCDKVMFLNHRFKKNKSGICEILDGKRYNNTYSYWNSSSIKKQDSIIDIITSGILRRRDFSAVFENDTNTYSLPLGSINALNIFSNVVFDTEFLKNALKNGIQINIFSADNCEYVGSFLPAEPLKAERLIFEQLQCYHDDNRRLSLAKDFVLAANHNIRLNIRYYNKYSADPGYDAAIERLYALDAKIKACKAHDKLLMLEAQSKNVYYSCFDLFLAGSGFVFDVRSKRPPKNEVNAMISFGNTVLYNLIAMEINKSALDIRIGFLHATNKRKNTLNLDIADVLKPLIVDRTVFSLINRKSINAGHFERFENGAVYLNKEGKEIMLSALQNKISTRFKFSEQSFDYRDIIKNEIAKLVRHFRDSEKYRAFRQVR